MMKTINPTLLKSISFIVFSFIFILAGTISNAQNLVSVEEILKAAESNHMSSEEYKVNVVQTILDKKTATANNATAKHEELAEYNPAKGLSRVANSTSSSDPTPTIMIDVGTFINGFKSLSNISFEEVSYNNRSKYLLTGSDSTATKNISFWLDKEYLRIDRIMITIKEQNFAEIDIHYDSKIKDLWLPQSVYIHHFTDNSEILLEFENYNFVQ